nr:hypothetical protein [uncultured Rhodopila sp.]
MVARIRLISAAAAVLFVGRAVDRGQATVVRDTATAAGNAAVATGGHRPKANPPVVIRYDLIGGFASQYPWSASCATWPWGTFNPLLWYPHDNAERAFPRLPGVRSGPFIGVPPRVP